MYLCSTYKTDKGISQKYRNLRVDVPGYVVREITEGERVERRDAEVGPTGRHAESGGESVRLRREEENIHLEL